MIGAASAYLSGLFFASFFNDALGAAMFLSIAVMVCIIAKVRHFSRLDMCMIFISFFAAVTVSATYTLNCFLDVTDFAGQTGDFSGVVDDYEIYDEGKASYIIKGTINGCKKAKIKLYTDELGADYGDTVTLTDCDFEAIENNYLFDSETWYKSRHIFIQVYKADNIEVKANGSASIRKLLASFRESTIMKMCRVAGKETGGFLAGMIFGEKQYIDDNTRTSLYRVGIGHILAVSGLHFSVISSAAVFLMLKLRVGRYARFLIVNLLMLFMIMLTNYPISAVRAFIMLDIMYAAPLFRRQNDSLNSLAVAVMIISISDPYIVYNSGFMLSVCGTFGIAVFGKFMTDDSENKIVSAVTSGLCTAFAVMPVNICYFDETSLISPFTNFLLVPLCSVAMMLGLIYIATGGIVNIPLYIADLLVKAVIKISDKLSMLDFTYMPRINNMIPIAFILSGLMTVVVYIVTGSRYSVSFVIAVSIMLCSTAIILSDISRKDKMIIASLGYGNNSALVVSHKGRTDIIDLSGHYRSPEFVRRYLSANGTGVVNTLILTAKTASADVNYEHEMKPFRISRRFATNDVQIYNNRLELLGKSGFSAYSGDYEMNYSNGTLKISYGDCMVTFSSARNNRYDGGLAVYYGNITKSTNIYRNSICLDDMNDFEIMLSENGEYRIRRLYA